MKFKKTIIIAILNQKGGVGKTTTVSTCGGILARMGNKVLLIDADQQANLTATYLTTPPAKSLMNTFEEGDIPIISIRENLDLIPADGSLSEVDTLMDNPDDRFILRNALTKVAGKYDFILIDCPPSLSWISNNAMTASDYVFAPAQADPKSLNGIDNLTRACYQTGTLTRINGIFFTMYKNNAKLSQRMEKKFRSNYGDAVMKTRIRPCIKAAECAEGFKDLISYAPKCTAAIDYEALVGEMLQIIEKSQK